MGKILGALVALVLVLVIVEVVVSHHQRSAVTETAAVTASSSSSADNTTAQAPASAASSDAARNRAAAERYVAGLKTSDDMKNLLRAGQDWEYARLEIVNDTHPSPEVFQATLPAINSAREKITGLDIQDACAVHAREAYLASIDARIVAYRKKAENQPDWYQAERTAFSARTDAALADQACIKS